MNKSLTMIALAIERSLISPNEADSNLEPANIVDAICQLARAISRLAIAVEASQTSKRGE